MARGPPKHQEGASGVREAREDSMEGGGGAGHLGEVLLHGKTGGDVFWGRDISVVGTNGSKTRGSSCGIPETGNEVGGKNSERRFVAEGGGVKSASGRGDTTATNPLRQEAGISGRIGALVAYL